MRRLFVISVLPLIACSPVHESSGAAAAPPSAPAIRPEVNGGEGYEFVLSGEESARSISLPATTEAMWRGLQQAYASMGIPPTLLDEANGTIGNPDLTVRGRLGDQPLSTLLNCGRILGGPVASTYRVRLSVTSTIRPDGSGTSLTTRVSASASDPASSSPGVRCTSTGEIEKRIAALAALGSSAGR